MSPRHYVHDRLWYSAALLLKVHRMNPFFSSGIKLATHIHLVPRYRLQFVKLYLHLSSVLALCGAQSQGNFSEESYLN
jgi:hypothetical protein